MTALLLKRRRMIDRGFTLIELMITVAIVAILASIALPAYRDSVLKGRRAQARTALLEFAQAQERCFTVANTYALNTTAGTDGGQVAACTGAFKLYSGDNPSGPAYLLKATPTCTGATSANQCLVLTAVPQFSDPQGNNISLWTTGFKTCDGSKPSVCWP